MGFLQRSKFLIITNLVSLFITSLSNDSDEYLRMLCLLPTENSPYVNTLASLLLTLLHILTVSSYISYMIEMRAMIQVRIQKHYCIRLIHEVIQISLLLLICQSLSSNLLWSHDVLIILAYFTFVSSCLIILYFKTSKLCVLPTFLFTLIFRLILSLTYT